MYIRWRKLPVNKPVASLRPAMVLYRRIFFTLGQRAMWLYSC